MRHWGAKVYPVHALQEVPSPQHGIPVGCRATEAGFLQGDRRLHVKQASHVPLGPPQRGANGVLIPATLQAVKPTITVSPPEVVARVEGDISGRGHQLEGRKGTKGHGSGH